MPKMDFGKPTRSSPSDWEKGGDYPFALHPLFTYVPELGLLLCTALDFNCIGTALQHPLVATEGRTQMSQGQHSILQGD